MNLRSFEVFYRIYDTPEQRSYSSGADITTIVQAQTYQQVQAMITGQFGGCAHIFSIREIH